MFTCIGPGPLAKTGNSSPRPTCNDEHLPGGDVAHAREPYGAKRAVLGRHAVLGAPPAHAAAQHQWPAQNPMQPDQAAAHATIYYGPQRRKFQGSTEALVTPSSILPAHLCDSSWQ